MLVTLNKPWRNVFPFDTAAPGGPLCSWFLALSTIVWFLSRITLPLYLSILRPSIFRANMLWAAILWRGRYTLVPGRFLVRMEDLWGWREQRSPWGLSVWLKLWGRGWENLGLVFWGFGVVWGYWAGGWKDKVVPVNSAWRRRGCYRNVGPSSCKIELPIQNFTLWLTSIASINGR